MLVAASCLAERDGQKEGKDGRKDRQKAGKGKQQGSVRAEATSRRRTQQRAGRQEAPEREGDAWQPSRTWGHKSAVWGTGVPVTQARSDSRHTVDGQRHRARTRRCM